MSIIGGSARMPGVYSGPSSTPRTVIRGNPDFWLAGGKVISGAASRDPGNGTDTHVLRAGLLMGRITASGKYAPSIVGAITEAYTSGGTELTVSAAVAAELDRLVGQAGTAELVAIGPPAAAGTVAVTDVTHSAIDTGTGVITVTSLGVNKIAGTLIAVKDGRQLPLTFIWDGHGKRVTDPNGTSMDVPFEKMPIGGQVYSAQLLPVWPSDASLRDWVRDQLNKNGFFALDYAF